MAKSKPRKVVVPPSKPRKTTPPASSPAPSSTNKPSSSPRNTGSNRTSSRGSNSGGGISGAERRANARADEAQRKARDRALRQARTLGIQAESKLKGLRRLRRARIQNLADLDRVLTAQLNQLRSNAKDRAAEFAVAAENNELATAGTEESSFANAVREAQESVANSLAMGAGETDIMKSMLMAARNLQNNLRESNRSYFDTVASINQGITDLNLDTQTAMANAWVSTQGDKEKVWQEYFDSKAEAWTEIGNIRGQQAEAYSTAIEMDIEDDEEDRPKALRGKPMKRSRRKMKNAYDNAAGLQGRSYRQKRIPKWIRKYEGADRVEAEATNTNLAAAPTFEMTGKAEGASLRRWA